MVLSSPRSSTEVAVGDSSATPCPPVVVTGAVSPLARRTITSAKSVSVGLVHARCTKLSPRAVTARFVTGPGAVSSGTASVRVVIVTPEGAVFPVVSRVNTAYEYWVSALSPLSVTDVAFAEPRLTAEPAVAEEGAVVPSARRTMIRARSASVGLIHDRATLLAVRAPTVNPVTGPGGVLSAAARVRVVTVTPAVVVLPVTSRVNTAYEYWVSALSPPSVTDVAFGDSSVTAVPAVAETGAAAPCARRTTTPARSASLGLVHDNATLLAVRVPTVNPDTGPGGVVSAGGGGVTTTGGLVGTTSGVDCVGDGVGVGAGRAGNTTLTFAVLPAFTLTLRGVTDAPAAFTV